MLPVVTSPTRGCAWVSPPAITCVPSIHPQATMSRVCLAPASSVWLSITSAISEPSGERYAGVGPWIASDCFAAPVQSTWLTFVDDGSSHSAPAGLGEPTGMHLMPPTVNRRAPVAGSTTWYSCGPQQPGPLPCVHEGTWATTRLVIPRQPIGHKVSAPVSLKI